LESHVKSVGRPCKKQGVEEGKTHTKGMIELYLSKVWDNFLKKSGGLNFISYLCR
jgi:hypothetical protein